MLTFTCSRLSALLHMTPLEPLASDDCYSCAVSILFCYLSSTVVRFVQAEPLAVCDSSHHQGSAGLML